MKNIFQSSTYTLVLILFISTFSNAQISLGVKGGISNAWEFYGDVGLPEGAQIDVNGYHFAILSYYELTPFLSVGVEPGYVQRGAACVPGWNEWVGDTKFMLNYIELPLMLRGNVSFFNDQIEIYGKTGISGGFVQKGMEIIDPQSDGIPITRTKIDFKDEFESLQRFDYGIYGGLGFAFNFGQNSFFIEGDYYHGLRDFDRLNTSKNRSIQLE